MCAGWRSDGTLVQGSLRAGRQLVTIGLPAPHLADVDVSSLPPGGVRRHRRLDVAPGPELLVLNAFFRDTHTEADGRETVIHEYAARAHVDARTLRVLDATADPHVLPYVECPTAAASAGRIAGRHLTALRDEVRAEFTGIGTCTHLNDLLRSFADAIGLLGRRHP
ncbi:DUF2889 domain-containing protein [Streptomyces sp. bgisy034]|uniref:DUF2889 domain-containing protein n=1 Tax=Streptomyces sp. bgisy034 TaxID=3413774 RepID=UPI003EBFB4A5